MRTFPRGQKECVLSSTARRFFSLPTPPLATNRIVNIFRILLLREITCQYICRSHIHTKKSLSVRAPRMLSLLHANRKEKTFSNYKSQYGVNLKGDILVSNCEGKEHCMRKQKSFVDRESG